MSSLRRADVLPLIRQALREDAAFTDATSRAIIPANTRVRVRIVAKAPGILAGGLLAVWTFQTLDRTLRCHLHLHSGAALSPGKTILTVEGRARSIFAAERVALNFLMHLSGIATLTRAFVDRVRGTRAVILDTRKTLPGLRALEKYAVRAGNGDSHRNNLAEAILIKTNHLRALNRAGECLALGGAIHIAKRAAPRKMIEVEVVNQSELREALHARPDVILLDNWRLQGIRRAVALRQKLGTVANFPMLEVSGGVTLDNVRAIAKTGVERISIGRLTHSAPALDCSLKVIHRGVPGT